KAKGSSSCGNFLGADRQFLYDDNGRAGCVCQQLWLSIYQTNVTGVNVLRLCADAATPTGKSRRVMLAEVGKRFDSLLGGAWIKDDLDEAQEAVVFDDELEGHKILRSKVKEFKVQCLNPAMQLIS